MYNVMTLYIVNPEKVMPGPKDKGDPNRPRSRRAPNKKKKPVNKPYNRA